MKPVVMRYKSVTSAPLSAGSAAEIQHLISLGKTKSTVKDPINKTEYKFNIVEHDDYIELVSEDGISAN